jgi:gliding motility-associated-like protein
VELLDFDNVTGVLTNPVRFVPDNTPTGPDEIDTRVYGAEFSPNGNLLYISASNAGAERAVLYQFDVTVNNAATILASKQIILNTSTFDAGALQIAPDQKIYFSLWKDNYISVIEDPDIPGPGCNFKYNKILLSSSSNATAQFGLPGFIQSYFDPRSFYDFTRSGSCEDRQIKFSLNKTLGIDSVKWDFGDSQTSQSLSPTNNYANPGFYDVQVIVYKTDCSGVNTETIVHRIWVAGKSDFLGTDVSICADSSVKLGITIIPDASYTWNTGATSNEITATTTGTYWMEIELNACRVRDSIDVLPKSVAVVNAGPDTVVCAFQPVILQAQSNIPGSYLWSTGETTSSISVNKTGLYFVTVKDNGCPASDTVSVTPGDCEVYFPSAFTPNNDSKNDIFGVATETTLNYFSMQIFNKWGQLVFTSNDTGKKWDGTFKGKDVPNGTYVWIVNYTNRRGIKIYDQGTVVLIR